MDLFLIFVDIAAHILLLYLNLVAIKATLHPSLYIPAVVIFCTMHLYATRKTRYAFYLHLLVYAF